jgi:hypothetical protein
MDGAGGEEMRYFTDDSAADTLAQGQGIEQALGVIGAWSDLDWDHAADELDRLRHASPPTPPIDAI